MSISTPLPLSTSLSLASSSLPSDSSSSSSVAVIPNCSPVSNLSTEHLEAEICSLAGSIAAASCKLLLLLNEFDRREGWAQWGAVSCAHWLSWKCGYSLGAARERVRVARALPSLPLVVSYFSRGELSYAKVRSITRIANKDNEAQLVEFAKTATTPQLERIVRAYRNCDDINERHEKRSFSWQWDEDGSLVFSGRLSPEDGAIFIQAIKDVSMETSCAGNAEALVELAKGASGKTPAHTTLVTVDEKVLVYDVDVDVDVEGQCYITDGPAIHPETARRLTCDGSIIGMTINAKGEPIDIGRKTRVVPSSIRRVLERRDSGACRFPGCTNSRYVDAHHIDHWSRGGATSLENLTLLCSKHHRSVHEEGFDIKKLGDGKLTFINPSGVTIPEGVTHNGEHNKQLKPIPSNAIESTGGGEQFDLGMAVDCLSADNNSSEVGEPLKGKLT